MSWAGPQRKAGLRPCSKAVPFFSKAPHFLAVLPSLLQLGKTFVIQRTVPFFCQAARGECAANQRDRTHAQDYSVWRVAVSLPAHFY